MSHIGRSSPLSSTDLRARAPLLSHLVQSDRVFGQADVGAGVVQGPHQRGGIQKCAIGPDLPGLKVPPLEQQQHTYPAARVMQERQRRRE